MPGHYEARGRGCYLHFSNEELRLGERESGRPLATQWWGWDWDSSPMVPVTPKMTARMLSPGFTASSRRRRRKMASA